ncbi:MAG: aminopeptidase P family protein [Chloroflexi bacterium]|nr:aminopeptidase P family protein [Chloroflexota bacterium]
MQVDRLPHLQRLIAESDVDAIALVPGRNIQYLTEVQFLLLERPFIVFVPAQGDPAIVIPALEMQQLVETGFPGNYFAWTDADGYTSAFQQASQALDLPGKRIGVEGLTMRVREANLITEHAPGAAIIDADAVLVDLRLLKSKEEIAHLRAANAISQQALEQLLPRIKEGMTERQIARMLSQLQRDLGGENDAFGPIVLVGQRTALPHGEPGDAVLKRGDAVLIDFGTRVHGYPSDITRTFFTGEPTDRMRKVYDTVLTANENARQTARPGITGAEIDQAATQILHDEGFGEYVKHRTGHGLGLDIHEHPNISPENTRPLEPNMVFTIEPGLYLTGAFGVRIEDNVVTTQDGAESLTTFPRELTVLDI